ncbi:hypothetical protein E8E13_000955 [Curvularia kusanoi]|uniref:Rhodopsin domain-containing protein n=1 Tax=Curvularia kusanoi TaxID=90978 RepID=A0A9P4T5A3_CURKU|nr:hypothetical protein E8E13_000955 [Curvularia kusanoi]
MRFTSRWLGNNPFWWDDWIHFVSAALCIPLCVIFELQIDAGLGKHTWDLTYPQVYAVGRWTYIATLVWGVEMLLLKYSILCLYLRIFPNVWLKRFVFAFMTLTACFTIPLIITAGARCNPVQAYWDLEVAQTAKCLDLMTILTLTVVYEIFAEIVLFALPVPIVVKLQMPVAKKVQLLIFFGLGILVIGVSIARVPFLEGSVDPSDQTYTGTGTFMGVYIASGLGHVCAAVPTTQSLLRYVVNGFKTPTQASSHKSGSYESGKKKNASNYSGDTLKASTQRSKERRKDGWRLSTQYFSRFEVDDELGDDRFMELRPVKQTGDSEGHYGGQKSVTTVALSPVLEDSSSDKAILGHEYMK